jgi:AraC-like DNA-binding protein
LITTGIRHDKGLYIQLVLKGDWLQKQDEQNDHLIRAGQFTLTNTPSLIFTSVFQKGIYITFDTFFSDNLIREFLPSFPSLKKITAIQEDGYIARVWADIETVELVHSILHCHYEKKIRRSFFNTRVRDLFFKYLVQWSKHDPGSEEPTGREILAVREAERIINADITKHITVPHLSKKVRLNEFRFKVVFKKILGMGPYEYLVRKRMKKAKELLQEGLSLKEVAAGTGYRPSDFTTAFTQQFGIKPSSLKKRH